MESDGNITSDQNSMGGVMVSVFASSVVDRGFEPGGFKPKKIKSVFADFLLSTQH